MNVGAWTGTVGAAVVIGPPPPLPPTATIGAHVTDATDG
jgi:hypothetical protein